MPIDGAQLKKLQEALISAFPQSVELEQMVLFGLNKDLNTITTDNSLQQAVFDLVRWAKAQNRVEELVKAALSQNPYNRELLDIAEKLGLPGRQTSSGPVGHSDRQSSSEPVEHSNGQSASRPAGTLLIRFLKFLFTRRPGWAIIGLSVLLAGVLWGISSPMVPYMKSEDVANAYSYVPQNSNIYIYPADNRLTVFIAQCDKLSPHIDCTKIQGSMKVAFLAHRDTISVNGNNVNPQPVQAHVIDELILSDAFGFSTTYTTSNYNASGTYDNHWWPGGFALIGCGLLIASVALFVVRKRHTSPSV